MNDNELRIMESLIKKEINKKIEIAQSLFVEWNSSHERRMARIDGMIEVLEMITDKEYIITENGLKTK